MDPHYTYVLCSSTKDLNAEHWQAVCSQYSHPYMDLRFIRAVEASMGAPAKYWFATFYDAASQPVACACYALYLVDGGIFLPPGVQSWFNTIRKVWRSFFQFKVLLQGLPVTTGESQLAVVPGVEMTKLAPLLDEIACKLARAEGSNFISVKELDESSAALLAPLENHGYRRADSVLTWTLKSEFASFDDYYNTRTKRTRANMRKYMKRFEDAGLRFKHVKGGEGADVLYTDDVHELYMAVFRRAAVKFEVLPAEFFREVARQMSDDSRFTFVYQGDKIVGYVLGLNSPHTHFLLLCGMDYNLNAQSDLYFNLLYRALEFAIADRTPFIRVGASADEFKKRLGSTSKRLYFYVKSPNAIVRWILNRVFPLVFPPFSKDVLAMELPEGAKTEGDTESASPSSPSQTV